MIDGLIFAAIVVIWDMFRSWVIAPWKTEKRVKKHLVKLEGILTRLDDKLEKMKNGEK